MSNAAKDQRRAAEVFREVIAVLDDASFDYAIGGGISTDYWTGGADSLNDIDILVREEDAPKILERLSKAGYRVAEMEHSWLHKAFKDDVTIDLMFELKNGTRFDDQLKTHMSQGDLFGTTANIVSAEDQVASLTGTLDRETVGQHWYSVIDLMAKNDLDWEYVLERAQLIPLKMLSVVYYAVAEQVPVQKGVIEQLVQIAADSKAGDDPKNSLTT